MADPDEPETDGAENEIMAAAKAAKKRNAAAAELRQPDNPHWPLQAIGIGVGSAALAAALLFVKNNRDKK